MQEYLDMWKNAFKFEGRARRRAYWMAVLFNAIAGIVLGILTLLPFIGVIFGILSWVYGIAVFIPALSLGVRRLHDIGKSGLYYLFCFIPLVGAIILLIWFCTDSSVGPNQYGNNPKELAY